jgi:Right handed beta helix region
MSSRRLACSARALPAALVAAVAACDVAVARDLHVDAASVAASDANAGTPGRPLKTISAGVAKAMPGDTVWVQSGTYRESIHFPRSGEGPDRPIRIVAARGAEVVIKGSDVVTGWMPAGGGIWTKTGWAVNSQQVFADGKPLQQIGATSPFNTESWGGQVILPPVGRGLSDMTPGSFFYDAASATLHVRLADDGDPNAHAIEASVRDVVIPSGPASFVELRELRFSHSNTTAIPSMQGIVNIAGRSWVVANCAFTYGDFAGLNVAGEGHRIEGSTASHNGNTGISIQGSDAAHGWAPYDGRPPQQIVLEGNETSDNNYRRFYPNYQAGGLKASNSCNGVRISRHVARGNAGTAVWFDLGCRDAVVEDSTFQDNRRGVEYETSDRAVIARNVITGSAEHGIYVSASSEVSVVENTLDGNGFGIVLHGEPRAEHPALAGNDVRRNVVRSSGKADLVVYVGPGAAGNTSDYNRFERRDGRVRISWTRTERYDVTHDDLRTFSDETGQERHSSTGDPQAAVGRSRVPGRARTAAGVDRR